MATLSDDDYMLSNVQWRKQEKDAPLRPLRGFTTGKLYVSGSTVRLEARFTDQNLSNRFSDLEEDGIPVVLQVTRLGDEDVYQFVGQAPTLERSGACYILRVRGKSKDLEVVQPAVS